MGRQADGVNHGRGGASYAISTDPKRSFPAKSFGPVPRWVEQGGALVLDNPIDIFDLWYSYLVFAGWHLDDAARKYLFPTRAPVKYVLPKSAEPSFPLSENADTEDVVKAVNLLHEQVEALKKACYKE